MFYTIFLIAKLAKLATLNSLSSLWLLETHSGLSDFSKLTPFLLNCPKFVIHAHKRIHILNILNARPRGPAINNSQAQLSLQYATWDIWLQLLDTGESSEPFPRICPSHKCAWKAWFRKLDSSGSSDFFDGRGGETIRVTFSSRGITGVYAKYQDLVSVNSEAVDSPQRLRRNTATDERWREGTLKKKEGRKGYLHMNTGLSLSLREWRRRGIYWFDKDSDEGTALGIELVRLGTGMAREPKPSACSRY